MSDRQLTVSEYETLYDVQLSQSELDVLRRLTPKVQVTPSYSSGSFDIKAQSWIGSIQADSLALLVTPKVPIERVLFMIAYAQDPGIWQAAPFGFRQDDSLVEAIAYGFVHQTRRALNRGLLRGYRSQNDSLLTVRGRVRFGDQVRKRFGRFPPAEITYDEYTVDIPENRMLLAALARLGGLGLRSRELRRSIRALTTQFQNVELVEYDLRSIPTVRFTRLNNYYEHALRLAELILRAASFRHTHGSVASSSFLINMDVVFEDFVRVAMREALGVSDSAFPKGASGHPLWLDRERVVKLEPDLSWWDGGKCVFVGDVKYKVVGASGAKNPDVYQMLAYMTATGLSSGMLVYAAGEAEAAEYFIPHAEKKVKVRILDLDQEPAVVLGEIDELAAGVSRGRQMAGAA